MTFLLSLAPGTVSEQERKRRRWRLTAQNREFLVLALRIGGGDGHAPWRTACSALVRYRLHNWTRRRTSCVEDTEAHGLRVKLPKSGKARTVSVRCQSAQN